MVSLTPSIIQQRAQTFDLVTVFELDLSGMSLDADSLSLLAGCENLERLDLSNTNIQSINQLPELPKLKTLILRDNKLSINQLASIKPQRSLRSIDLTLSNPKKQSTKHLLSGLTIMSSVTQLPLLDRLTLGLIDCYDHSLLSSLTRAFPSLIWLDSVKLSTHSKLIAQVSRADEFERNQSISKICPPLLKVHPSPRRNESNNQSNNPSDELVDDARRELGDLDELDDACEDALKMVCNKFGISVKE